MRKITKKIFAAAAAFCIVFAGVATTQTEAKALDWIKKATEKEQVVVNESYTVTYKVLASWWGGFNGTITIENTGEKEIVNWYLKGTVPNVISNVWNGELYSVDEYDYVFKNAGWNANIAPGEKVSIGFSSRENFSDFSEKGFKLLGEKSAVAPENFKLEYKLDSDWGTGFTANITIFNLTEKPIEDWTVEFDFNRDITNIWNGKLTKTESGRYVVTNCGYNANIPVGGMISFGFMGEAGVAEDVPSEIKMTSFSYSGDMTKNFADQKEAGEYPWQEEQPEAEITLPETEMAMPEVEETMPEEEKVAPEADIAMPETEAAAPETGE